MSIVDDFSEPIQTLIFFELVMNRKTLRIKEGG